MWKKRIIQAVWILAGAGTIVLLVSAMQKKSNRQCSAVEIDINSVTEHVFVDKQSIIDLLKTKGSYTGTSIAKIDLRNIEEALEKDPWVRNAELFFDNKQVLQVSIDEREPVARIFTVMGNSFYLDSSGMVLPLSEKLSARVPVFTGFPFGKKLSRPDSLLLRDVITLSNYIYADSFWNAQIAQVDITGNEFDMVPVIGNHIIKFGDVSNMEKKFRKLFSFYKNVSTKVGFDKYETIDLKYDGQIVATRRGEKMPVADSAAANMQLQNALQTTAQVMSGDTSHTMPAAMQPRAVMRNTLPQRH